MTLPESPVGEVPAARIDEVIQVLSEAFSDYEAMRYLLGGPDRSYSSRLRTLVSYFAESRVAAGSPILGVDVGRPHQLVAAALFDPPQRPPKSAIEDLTKSLGPQVTQRLRHFETALAPLEPSLTSTISE